MDFDLHVLCRFLYFCDLPVATIIMIDSSETHNSLVGVEVQSPYVLKGAVIQLDIFSIVLRNNYLSVPSHLKMYVLKKHASI